MANELNITDISLEFNEGQEILNLGGNYFNIDRKGLSLTISEIPSSFLYHISQNISRSKELFLDRWKQTTIEERITNQSKQMTAVYSFADSIKNEIISLNNYENDPAFFIIVYPLMAILVEYRIHYGFQTYVERTPAYVRNSRNDYIGYLKGSAREIAKNPIKAIFKEKTSECELMFQTTEGLLFYLCEISGRQFVLSESNLPLHYKCLINMSESILRNIDELLTLKQRLTEYLNLRLSKKINSFAQTPDWIKTAYFESRKSFNVLTITQAISIEQHHTFEQHKYYKICQICGRPFYANKSNTKYCDCPNADYSGKTCREIGNEKIKASKSPLHKTYLNNQKVYRNWINRNKKNHPEILDDQILQEIEKKYKAWNAQALKSIILFEDGAIDFDKAIAMMAPPENPEKSYLLDRLLHK